MQACRMLHALPPLNQWHKQNCRSASVFLLVPLGRYHLLHAHDGRTGAPSKSAWSYSHGVIFLAELRPHPPVCLLFPDTHQGGGGVTSPASTLGVGDLIYGLV